MPVGVEAIVQDGCRCNASCRQLKPSLKTSEYNASCEEREGEASERKPARVQEVTPYPSFVEV